LIRRIVADIHAAYQHRTSGTYAVFMTGSSGSGDIGGKAVARCQGVSGSQRHAAVHGVSDLSKAIPTNIAASAKQRLLNRARAKKEKTSIFF
jgi:hypothetical protein